MTDKEKTIKELKEALDSLDITNKYRLNIIRAIEYLQEEHVSEGLEEAALEFEKNNTGLYPEVGETSTYDSFKAGAKWQKDKMMQNTIDAQCFGFQGDALFSFRLPADNYLVGSEVKVIVIKKDEL